MQRACLHALAVAGGLLQATGCNTLLGIEGIEVVRDSAPDPVDAPITPPSDVLVDAAPLTVCPTSYVFEHARSKYRFVSNSAPWPDARDMCSFEGTHLVVIETADEDDAVHAHATSVVGDTVYLIGARQTDRTGPWYWVNGAPMSYRGWASGEPSGGDSENCAKRAADGWRATHCANLETFICECTPTTATN